MTDLEYQQFMERRNLKPGDYVAVIRRGRVEVRIVSTNIGSYIILVGTDEFCTRTGRVTHECPWCRLRGLATQEDLDAIGLRMAAGHITVRNAFSTLTFFAFAPTKLQISSHCKWRMQRLRTWRL